MSAKIALNLLGQRRYLPLLVAQTLGAFNDNFFRYALITLVTYASLSVFGLDRDLMNPIAASAFTIPIFLFSAIAGRVADKFDRTRILRFTKFAEIWLMVLAAAGFIFEQPLLLLVTLFLMGMQSAFFAPAKNSALPTLLTPRELVPGNAMISGSLNMAVLIGIGLGGLLIEGPQGTLIVGAVLIGVAITGWLTMRALSPAPAENPDMPISFNFVAETYRVLKFAFKHPPVLRPLLGAAWFWMLAAAIVFSALPSFATSILGADNTVLTMLMALFTVGSAVGALLCGALSGDGESLPLSIAGAIGLLIFPADIALHTWGRPIIEDQSLLIGVAAFVSDSENWRVLFDFLMSAVSAGLFVVPLQAMAQRRAPADIRGRLMAAGGIMNAAAATLGQFALVGIVLLGLQVQAAFLLVASVSGLAAIYIFHRWRKAKPA
jgi:MFS family permease